MNNTFKVEGLNDNNISNIDALAGLKNLDSLFLARNKLTDISSLEGLLHLEIIDLSSNNIKDILLVLKVAMQQAETWLKLLI